MSDPTPLPSASELLREARIARELSPEQVSQLTRIPAELILALEERRWDALPGAPYARAFSRTLAVAYELDPEIVLAGLRNDMGLRPAPTDTRAAMELRLGSTTEKTGIRTPVILGGIIGLALLLVIAATRLVFQSGSTTPRSPSDALRGDTTYPADTLVPVPAPVAVPKTVTAPSRRTVTISLTDTTKTTFVLYIRSGIRKVRKKTLGGPDTLEFDPDTSIMIRNLSGRPLRLTGAATRDSLLLPYFRVVRRADSVRIENVHEEDWSRMADPIIKKSKKKIPD